MGNVKKNGARLSDKLWVFTLSRERNILTSDLPMAALSLQQSLSIERAEYFMSWMDGWKGYSKQSYS